MTIGRRPGDRIAGVDEAGRGPMIGPMVVCGLLVDSSGVSALQVMGVKDSKMLSPRKRRELDSQIRETAQEIVLRSISAKSIDTSRRRGTTMNEIEVHAFASVLRELSPGVAYLDAADVNAQRFGQSVAEMSSLTPDVCHIVSEHRADSKYVVVSAASVVAKVERDTAIERLHRKYGDFGSGYPSDSKTVEFVRDYIREGRELPSIVRSTWKSVSEMTL